MGANPAIRSDGDGIIGVCSVHYNVGERQERWFMNNIHYYIYKDKKKGKKGGEGEGGRVKEGGRNGKAVDWYI